MELSSAVETDRSDVYGEQNSIQANHRYASLSMSLGPTRELFCDFFICVVISFGTCLGGTVKIANERNE